MSDGTQSCSATVAAGNCTIAFTSPGTRTVTASYPGDGNYATSTSTGVGHTVNQAATATTITSVAPEPSTVGQATTVSFSVTSSSGTPTGTVTVSDGTEGCSGTVAAGSCSVTFPTAGAKTLIATYAGDGTFAGSTSTSVGHTVNAAATTTAITGQSPNPSTVGQAVDFTFAVTAAAPGSGTPTGTVTVSDGTQSCSATVAAGNCSITFTSVGGRTVTASYPGDGNFAGSTSVGVGQTVNTAPTTTTITSDTPDPSVAGEAFPVTFSVSFTSAGTPTGNVTVSDGTASCTGSVAVGTCSLTLTAAGTHTLTATYAGDANFTGSTSSGEAHTVAPAAASQLVFTVQPSNTQFDAIITPPVQVTAADAFGNIATDFAGSVTIAIGTDGSPLQNAKLHGNLIVAAANGVATFSDLSIDQVGGGYKLVVSATTGPGGATSQAFNITLLP